MALRAQSEYTWCMCGLSRVPGEYSLAMHATTVVPPGDLVLADAFMALIASRIQTTSVLPLLYAVQLINVDGVENPTECLT